MLVYHLKHHLWRAYFTTKFSTRISLYWHIQNISKSENFLIRDSHSYEFPQFWSSQTFNPNLPGRSVESWQRSVLIALLHSATTSCTTQTCSSCDPCHPVAGIHCSWNIQNHTQISNDCETVLEISNGLD